MTTISGNSAGNSGDNSAGGGVFNYHGPATLSNSTISDNSASFGGGVHNFLGTATLTLTDSTISGNSATYGGGGVYNILGTVTLSNSTISDNSTSYTISGNSASYGRGGGVSNHYGTATLNNSTISGNSAGNRGGGVYNNLSGTATLSNSTISGNSAGSRGGGVYNNCGTATLSRTLIAGNTAAVSGAEVYNNTGSTITADNFNLVGHDGVSEAAAFSGFTPGATDINATTGCTTTICTSTALSAILDPLALNAPGTTETHALRVGSPAIDASPDDIDCAPTDQRGVERPQGAACDIGAFEGGGGPMHDLAVVKVTPPKTVTLTSKKPVQSKAVTVQIQNQGEVDESIPNAGALASLVQLDLESLDTVNNCPDLVATLVTSNLRFPLTLKAGNTPSKGKKLTVSFTVTFDRNGCIPDPLMSSKKNPGHEDYRPTATVDLSALGVTDVDPTDDTLQGQLIDVVKKP
jgi:hypothetical protein